jgi:arabinofuranosyltransferase
MADSFPSLPVMPSDDRRPVAGGVFSRREAILLASAATTVVATLTVLLSSRITLDDAYITFRYARHLAEGYGLGAWNRTGEHVEGYSSLLWTLLLGGAARLGADVRIASKVFGTAAALIVMAVLFRRRDDRPAVLTGVFLALYLPFAFYAASGMEAVAFTSLVTLALVGPAAWQPIVAPLLIAMRPEGALVVAVDVAALAWRRERRRWIAATTIAGGLTFVAVEVHRWLAYGALAPNTYYAKVAGGGLGHVRLGLVYVGGWMLAHAAIVVFLVIGALTVTRARRAESGTANSARGLTCLALFLAYIVYMTSAGGDPPTAFPVWRQFVHVAPAWLLVAMTGVTTVVRDRRWMQVSVAVGLALAANLGVFALERGGPRPGAADYTAWLASIASPSTTISSSYAGGLPFVIDAVHIDALGLNTPYIARHGTFDPDGPQDSKTDMRWVIEQRPDIVEGYLSGLALLRGAGPEEILGVRRRKMIREMVSSPRFQREYVFVRNAPYDRMDRAVFLRRDFWEAHPRRDALDCVPVAETTLAAFAGG